MIESLESSIGGMSLTNNAQQQNKAGPRGGRPRVRRAEGAGAGRRRAGHEHRRIGTLGFRAGLQLRGCRADLRGDEAAFRRAGNRL